MKEKKEHKFWHWFFMDGFMLLLIFLWCVTIICIRPEWWLAAINAGVFVVITYTLVGISNYIDYRKAKKEKQNETHNY